LKKLVLLYIRSNLVKLKGAGKVVFAWEEIQLTGKIILLFVKSSFTSKELALDGNDEVLESYSG